jgi:hypothetical protein
MRPIIIEVCCTSRVGHVHVFDCFDALRYAVVPLIAVVVKTRHHETWRLEALAQVLGLLHERDGVLHSISPLLTWSRAEDTTRS